jgi:biotin synthase-like enzyme
MDLIKKANKTYMDNFKPETWFGRCIFLSWYCDIGTCKFCYRSTQKNKIKHAKNARRSLPSILTETLLAKKLNWKIEFLTGGYKIFPVEELVDITKKVNYIYGEKTWINLGALKKEELSLFKPYIKGIVGSIETIEPSLHDKICPNKPIYQYEKMFNYAKNFKKSITIVIGLGEKKEHFPFLCDFIKKHKLDRITFYALKPINGTPYTKGPSTKDYIWWIANTRINFPKLEIIAGTTLRRVDEVGKLLKSGANAITKFPITKKFASKEAKIMEEQIKLSGRKFKGYLTNIPKIDWDKEVDKLKFDKDLKQKIKLTLNNYLKKMMKI